VLSVAVYNHYKRLSVNITDDATQPSQNTTARPAVVVTPITPATPSNPPRGMWFVMLVVKDSLNSNFLHISILRTFTNGDQHASQLASGSEQSGVYNTNS
jgi:hypothetical protein